MKGSSAGSLLIDYYGFAYHDDPLVRGLYMDSGSAFLNNTLGKSPDTTHSNFTFVAAQLGCGGLDPSSEVRCMQNIPFNVIQDFVGQYQDNSTDVSPSQPPLVFVPVIDNTFIFPNYTERYMQGKYSNLPYLQSTTSNEGSALIATGANYPIDDGAWPNQTAINEFTLNTLVCTAMQSSIDRASVQAPTYRFQWSANISTVSPLPWLGAYHGSDLPYIFGSFQDYLGRPPPPPFAFTVSRTVQDLLYAFAQDPDEGLAKMGFPDYRTGYMLRLGADNTPVQTIPTSEVEFACSGDQASLYDYNP